MFRIRRTAISLLIFSAFLGQACATSLTEAAEKALMQNPEVLARYHTLLASIEEKDAARGNYYPRIDLQAYAGHQWQDTPTAGSSNFSHPGASITLRQLLFDGFATRNDVRRLGYARLTRYYELLSTSDEIALEAARAYLDVQRYRHLTRLAQGNWNIHKEIYDQLEQRAKAGVGRRIDLEQAAGRMALAQSNWLTETSNEHDVSARYQRIVGDIPDALSPAPDLAAALPTEKEVLAKAIGANPAFQASIANMRAARAETDARRANNMPTVELRASHGIERNRLGERGRYNDSEVQVVLNYNLLHGGSDQARIRQGQELYYAAMDQRDRSCREIRQVTAIAWNDVRRLKEQLAYLQQHQLSTEKTRAAYRQQFDIGQRSLLDVLDTENEYFQASRALVVAQYDLKLAQFRVLAQTHQILPALNLAAIAKDAPEEAHLNEDAADNEIRCNTEMPPMQPLDTAAAARAQ